LTLFRDGRRAFPRPTLSIESLIVATSLFWLLALNRPFFAAALQGRSWGELAGLSLGASLVLIVVAVHALLLAAVSTHHTVKPVVAALTLVGAFAMHYMHAYGVVIDPTMVRNALATDIAETSELLSWRLARDLLIFGVLPVALLIATRIERRSWRSAVKLRLALVVVALVVLFGAMLWQFQPLSALVRNHKETRYLITPANAVWSLTSVLAIDARQVAKARVPIGQDATAGPGWATRERPRLVVLVVGETARAMNWGLNGYARQTTPELAKLPRLINFTDVTSCGTNTEVSLPCMFAPVGRRDYDEARIRNSESLLHVVARAGVGVKWIDNQSGCKGVCEGLPNETLGPANAPGLCQDGRCWDEALLLGLDDRLKTLATGRGTQLLVLHMLGNHGPSYYKRYPSAFERFTPACRNDDLGRCPREQIVNAYDNVLLYTDHLLAALIGKLQSAAGVDTAMLYVSDHGESLGEKNLFLHGVPYSIAPREQTQVPMVMWWSDGFGRSVGLNADCMRARARQSASHDHLFHSLLALLDVKTSLYAGDWDLTRACRAAP
jgi:lipid A ethanolaminephosphotransferase